MKQRGFTLIEVLIALAITAIALTALIRSNSQTVVNTLHLKEKIIGHWVAMQAISSIQLGTIHVPPGKETTEVTKMFGQTWYWRALITPTTIPTTLQITIRVSRQETGPFRNPLIGYEYLSS